MPAAPSSQSGNIFIYILGGIFLMGLLVVVVRGSSTPGSNIDHEGLMIKVSEVQQYGDELEKAVSFILREGFSESDIRFAHPSAAGGYGTITDNTRRQVFHREGGGATFRAPPTGIQTTASPWIFSGHNRVSMVGTTNATAGSAELVALLPHVSMNFCMMVNQRNNITNPSNAPPVNSGNINITNLFQTTYAASGFIQDAGDVHLAGVREGCVRGAAGQFPSATYIYFRVLLAR